MSDKTITSRPAIPTIEDYQRCNYEPATALVEAITICHAKLATLTSRVNDCALHRVQFKQDWAAVNGFATLAAKLAEIESTALPYRAD